MHKFETGGQSPVREATKSQDGAGLDLAGATPKLHAHKRPGSRARERSRPAGEEADLSVLPTPSAKPGNAQ